MPKRRRHPSLLAGGVALAALLVGCGPKGEPATDDAGFDEGATSEESVSLDEIDACGGLTADLATLLVGERVSLREEGGTRLPSCEFVGSPDEPGSLIQVLALPMGGLGGFTDFDQVIDSQRTGEGDIEIEEVDLEGADQAALIDDDGYGLASTTLVAVADGVAYTVYPSGVTRDEQARVARGALSAVLTGELPEGTTIELGTDDVCSLVSDKDLSAALGTTLSSSPSSAAGASLCTWGGAGLDLVVVDLGSTNRIESLADLGADDDTTTVTPVEVGEGSEAYVTESELGVNAYVALDHRLYSLDLVLRDDGDETQILTEAIVQLATG